MGCWGGLVFAEQAVTGDLWLPTAAAPSWRPPVRARLERALAISQAELGPDHPTVATTAKLDSVLQAFQAGSPMEGQGF